MAYLKGQFGVDKKRKVCRVLGICFEEEVSDEQISEVLMDISNIGALVPSLMTKGALCRYIEAPECVQTRMSSMAIRESFLYDGLLITRWSEFTYNGKSI